MPWSRPFVFLTCAAFLLNVCGCGSDSNPRYDAKADPQSRYSSAVQDARTVTSAKISVNLTPITNDNSDLIWENGITGSRVLVLSRIRSSDAKYYDGTADPACRPGSANCTLKADLWVTVAPEMKTFFCTSRHYRERICGSWQETERQRHCDRNQVTN